MVLNAMIRNTHIPKRRPSHQTATVRPGAPEGLHSTQPHAAGKIERATA